MKNKLIKRRMKKNSELMKLTKENLRFNKN